MENKTYTVALNDFLAVHNQKIKDYYAANFKNLTPPTLQVKEGTRYDRIISGTSAWAFIDRTSGDIFKPASYKAPAKHARGNIFQPDSWSTITAYGPAYLK